MNMWIKLAILAAIWGTISANSVTGGKVMQLTDYTFDEAVQKHPIMMVLFYAPWCSKSKAFLPEYDKAALMADKIGKSYVLAKVDASSEGQVADKMEISMYPVLKLFLNGKPMNYEGKEMNAEAVIRFIDRTLRPPSVELTDKVEIDNLKLARGIKVFFT